MLIDKGYYDYDYETPKKDAGKDFVEKSDKELAAMFGYHGELKTKHGGLKGLDMEDLQTRVRADINAGGEKHK